MFALMHARSVIPNNPKNIGGKHPDGSVGRGVQYPFISLWMDNIIQMG